MSHQLSAGALAQICQGQDITDPVLQVLGHKPIQGSGQERYRLLLSDGQFSNSFSMLADKLNPMIHNNQLAPFTVIKVKKHICNQVGQQTKKVVVILEAEILTPGDQVGAKLGDPSQIGSDGKIPDPVRDKLTALRSKLAAASDPTGAMEKMCIEDGIFSDWTIISKEGQRFPCHRLVFAAKSSTMKAMMTSDMKEKEVKETKIRYNNPVVGAFVDYFYKGKVPSSILEENLSSFLDLSVLYNLDPLKAQVEDLAIQNLTMKNVVEMFCLAKLYKAGTLQEATEMFIVENKKILGKQDFSQVPQSVMTDLFILLSQS